MSNSKVNLDAIIKDYMQSDGNIGDRAVLIPMDDLVQQAGMPAGALQPATQAQNRGDHQDNPQYVLDIDQLAELCNQSTQVKKEFTQQLFGAAQKFRYGDQDPQGHSVLDAFQDPAQRRAGGEWDLKQDQIAMSLNQGLNGPQRTSGTNSDIPVHALGDKRDRLGSDEKQEPEVVDRWKARLERNRLNQKRFRERQKVRVQSASRQIQELQLQLESIEKDRDELQSQNAALKKMMIVRSHISAAEQTNGNEQQQSGPNKDTQIDLKVELSSNVCKVKVLTGKQIQEFTVDDIFEIMRPYTQELASLLQELDNSSNQQAANDRIGQLVGDIRQLLENTIKLNPLVVRHWLARRGNPSMARCSEDEVQEKMQDIPRLLDLKSTQKKEIYFSRKIYLERMDQCLKQRRELASKLQEISARGSHGAECSLGMRFLKAQEASDKLRSNLQEEQAIYFDLLLPFFFKIISNLQYAKTLVHCYPVQPDVIVLSNIVSIMAQEELNLPTYFVGQQNNVGSAAEEQVVLNAEGPADPIEAYQKKVRNTLLNRGGEEVPQF